MRTAILLAMALGLSGCGAFDSLSSGDSGFSGPFSGGGGLRGSAADVDGVRFRTRVTSDRADPRNFQTATRDAARAPSAAIEAGRVEAVGYCLRTVGGGEIDWTIGPDGGPEAVTLDGSGALVLRGRCVSR